MSTSVNGTLKKQTYNDHRNDQIKDEAGRAKNSIGEIKNEYAYKILVRKPDARVHMRADTSVTWRKRILQS
jgi:gamma-glutamylcyclotransferase (GGCT)/AIG2-like uncharacterized protein YtfP